MDSNLEHLEVKFWPEMVICHPELEDKCPWEQLGPTAWHDILVEHPEFIRHAPKKITLSFMSANQWLEVLIAHPELDAYLPAAKSLFRRDSRDIGNLWATLLSRHPEFAKYEPSKRLRSEDWMKVLRQQPQFIANYERDRSQQSCSWPFRLHPNEQAEVISCQPSLFNRFDSGDFSGGNWETILANQPQFRDRCNLNAIDPHSLGRILQRRPDWLAYCDTYSKTPTDILSIAECFPEVLKHFDLDKFSEIGGGDTPWMEKYPCLVPYSRWNFSYNYWDVLLTRLSDWQKNRKRKYGNALSEWGVKSTKTEVTLQGRSIQRKIRTSFKRPLPENPTETNLRNSIDSIMDLRYWLDKHTGFDNIAMLPLRISNILQDMNLTYEQLMIKMSMMSAEDCGLVFYGLFIAEKNEFLDAMLGDDLSLTVRQVPVQVLLPLAIMYVSSSSLYSVMFEIITEHGCDAIANFRDKAGNNAWHYFFFRKPLYCPSRNTQDDALEYNNYEFLADNACSPDTPNNMGFSYNQIYQAMEKYLKVDK